MAIRNVFSKGRASLIAMIHVAALPGTPGASQAVSKICRQALREAEILVQAGVDVLLFENMHDRPYMAGSVGPEITAAMTAVGSALRAAYPKMPIGVQVLAGANTEALAVACAADLDFVRVEGFTFAHIADEGWIHASASDLLRKRSSWDAAHIKVFADVKKKHASHAVTSDLSVEELASASEFFLCDGVVLTGPSTGRAADISELQRIRTKTTLPVLIGSGITPESADFIKNADGLIVGSYLKKGGNWQNGPDKRRVEKLVKAVRG